MIPRYSRPQMSRIWEPETKFQTWLEIELAVCEGWEKLGRIPKGTAAKIRKKAKINIPRIDEIEKEVKHDVIAFLTQIAESAGPDCRWLHWGMTSSDLLDTCFSIQLKEAADLILEDLKQLLKILEKKARQYKDVPMIGRTHGIHAEPITFGLKVAGWYAEVRRYFNRIELAREEVAVGKISGAVGTYAHLEPSLETFVCEKLGLKPDTVSTQVISRDRYAVFFARLGLLSSSLERIATEIRHLQRTEVLEAEEFFSEGQKGSSAMPHKRNPILSENICGLARLIRSAAAPAMENIPLWHERDISHSSVERIIGPQATILTDFLLARLADLIEHLVVYPKNMQKNLEKMGKLVFSEGILVQLVAAGLTREESYRLVQRHAMRTWKEGIDFEKSVRKDALISRRISGKEFDKIFNLKNSLRHVDTIFKRVFNTPS